MLESLLKRASLLDVFIVVIGSIAVVGFWRGSWNLMDYYLFPQNFFWSQVISIVGGILLLFILSRYK